MLEGNGPKWLFDLDSLTQSMNYVPVVAGTFSNDSAGIQGVSESSTSSQQDQANQDFNTASPEVNTGSREVSTIVPEVSTATPEDLMGPIPISEDTQVEDQEIELGNISPSYAVSFTPHTRVHKDHPIDHVIGDVQSSVQTRIMTTSYSGLGFLSAIYEEKTHQDLHTCLFSCFLSQEEPKRVSKALSDPAWVEAMQEELLQFKLQKVWVLVDLPKGHRAIDDIILISTKKELCEEFEKLVKDKFSDDVLWEILTFLFRVKVSPKTSHLLAVKRIFRYLKGKPSLGLWYSKDSPLELVAYTDSDYAGATIDRKYTTT
ncbi:hypothetical protein Tco_1311610 [Tanacetum coccineum]